MTSYFVNERMNDPVEPQLDSLLNKAKVSKEATLEAVTNAGSTLIDEPVRFHIEFADQMVLWADAQTVAKYFDTHQQWFQRCAQPMHTEPIGENGYALTIGKFGALGYDVEPKIGLELLPQQAGIYHIQTIAIPDYTPPGYEVNFQAWQKLVEVPSADYMVKKKSLRGNLPPIITKVEWHLDLEVFVKFPRFLQKLPQNLIQNTGDRLLLQIIQLVNHRLTQKVQQDFHSSLGIPH
jgi:Protein of unknown function (DUF1997)